MKFECGICNKEFENMEEYLTHVSSCAVKKNEEETKRQEDEKRKLEDINGFLNEIKKYQNIVDSTKARFKEKYPNEYEMNFDKEISKCKENIEPNKKFYGSVNGEKCNSFEEFINKMRGEFGW